MCITKSVNAKTSGLSTVSCYFLFLGDKPHQCPLAMLLYDGVRLKETCYRNAQGPDSSLHPDYLYYQVAEQNSLGCSGHKSDQSLAFQNILVEEETKTGRTR